MTAIKFTTGETFKIGVWGTGRQSRQHRVPGFMALRAMGVRVRSLGDINLAAADALADDMIDPEYCKGWVKTGYPVEALPREERPRTYSSLEEMLADPEIHGIAVLTPHQFHAEATIAAAKAGKHVLCEKPLATKPGQAPLMVATAEECGVVLMAGYQASLALARGLQLPLGPAGVRAALGDIVGGSAAWLRFDMMPGDEGFYNDEYGTGVGRDLAPHLIAALVAAGGRDLFTAVLEARGSRDFGVARFGDRFKGFDTINTVLQLRNGGEFVIDASWQRETAPEDAAWFTLYGSQPDSEFSMPLPTHRGEGYVPALETMRPVLRAKGIGTEVGPEPLSFVRLIAEQGRTWVQACRGEAELPFSGRDALAVETIIDAIQTAAIEGRRVDLDIA